MFSENRAAYEIMWKNMVEPDSGKIWYSQTVEKYGRARQWKNMVEPDSGKIW
jgi:hypothetical protein